MPARSLYRRCIWVNSNCRLLLEPKPWVECGGHNWRASGFFSGQVRSLGVFRNRRSETFQLTAGESGEFSALPRQTLSWGDRCNPDVCWSVFFFPYTTARALLPLCIEQSLGYSNREGAPGPHLCMTNNAPPPTHTLALAQLLCVSAAAWNSCLQGHCGSCRTRHPLATRLAFQRLSQVFIPGSHFFERHPGQDPPRKGCPAWK